MTVAAKTETPEEIRRRISEEKRRRLLDRNQRLASLDAPMRDPGFVQSIAKAEGKLLTAQANLDALRAGDPKRNRKAIKRAENQVRDLAEELARLQEVERAAYLAMGEAREPLLRALQRGEIVQAKEAVTADFARGEHGERIIIRGGPMRGLPALVYSRGLRARKLTGIARAFADGKLRSPHGPDMAEALLAIGNRYGEAYLVTTNALSPSGGGAGGYGAKGPQLKLIEAADELSIMRRDLTKRQVGVLDRVCGEERSIRQAALAMRAGAPATERALRSGLLAALKSLALARERGRGSEKVWTIATRAHLVDEALRSA